MFVKVCGLKTKEQIDWAIELGYSAIGIVLHKKSIRYCDIDKARDLAEYGRGKITTVAVGIKYREVAKVHSDFDYIQIYDYKKTDRLIYGNEKHPGNKSFDYFLYDVSRGKGIFYAPPSWINEFSHKLILSGGLHVHNIRKVIKGYNTFGVDVSSGVEVDKGTKSYSLMKNFIEEVHNATN